MTSWNVNRGLNWLNMFILWQFFSSWHFYRWFIENTISHSVTWLFILFYYYYWIQNIICTGIQIHPGVWRIVFQDLSRKIIMHKSSYIVILYFLYNMLSRITVLFYRSYMVLGPTRIIQIYNVHLWPFWPYEYILCSWFIPYTTHRCNFSFVSS